MRTQKHWIVLMLFFTCSAHAQITIVKDTLSYCNTSGREEPLVFPSQEEFESSRFIDNEDCLPIEEIDFDNNILIGYKYQGSNCDMNISIKNILADQHKYTIQFAICDQHVCRDFAWRIAWFVIRKPAANIPVTIEKVDCFKP